MNPYDTLYCEGALRFRNAVSISQYEDLERRTMKAKATRKSK